MALQLEAKLEAWLKSVGKGADEDRPPSQARAEFMAWQEKGAPDSLSDKHYRWSSPTEVDDLSELGSGYDENSWSDLGAAAEATPLRAAD